MIKGNIPGLYCSILRTRPVFNSLLMLLATTESRDIFFTKKSQHAWKEGIKRNPLISICV